MDRITEFVDSFIPKTLPKKRQKQLKDELYCHLLDKADYYRELGFNKQISFHKSIEDFGTDTDMKNYILGEFEELYKERTVWGIFAGVFIWALNILCYSLDLWVASADYNREPDPAGAFCSFLMIFCIMGLIIFARIKKYRKMLLGIGISNLSVVLSMFLCFYPQMAAYSMGDNIVYLVDRFTPFLLGNTWLDGIFSVAFYYGIPSAFTLYSVITSILLKKGKLDTVKNPKKKCIITGILSAGVCLVTCILQPTGDSYIKNYPEWFSPYDLYIAEETDYVYNEIFIGKSIEDTEKLLKNEGFQSLEEYRSFLDKLGKKQFDADVEAFVFPDGYTMYFSPENHIEGQGLVGIKEENGIVTGVSIGNVKKYMYDSNYETFGYYNSYNWKTRDDIDELYDWFGTLRKGDREESIMSLLGDETGEIYAKRKYTENGKEITYYRIYFYGLNTVGGNPDDYRHTLSCHLELMFEDGALAMGNLYSTDYDISFEENISKMSIK